MFKTFMITNVGPATSSRTVQWYTYFQIRLNLILPYTTNMKETSTDVQKAYVKYVFVQLSFKLLN